MKKKNDQKYLELEQQIAELTAGWQRTQADFLNFKKQTADERIKLIAAANKDLILQLLPVLDNFQLAAKHIPAELEKNNWVVGIKQIEKQFENILSESGLERIEAVGREFDPSLHEAVSEVESEKPEGTVVEEVLSGYKYAGEVIRPTKAKIARR